MKLTNFFVRLIILLTFFNSPIRAQNSIEIDSLLNALSYEKADTNRAKLFSSLANRYAEKRQTSAARLYADSLLGLSKALKDKKGVAEAHYAYGRIERFEGNFEEALIHIHTFNQHFRQIGDSATLVRGLFQAGTIYRALGDFEKCLPYYFRALKIYEDANELSGVAPILNSIGVIYDRLKQYDQAITMYKRAFTAFDSLGNQKNMSIILNNLGIVYRAKKKYSQAKEYLNKALEISKVEKIRVLQARILINLGSVYNLDDQHEEALSYMETALKLTENTSQNRELAACLRSIGATHLKLGHFEEASFYLSKGLRLSQKINAKPLIKDCYQELAALEGARKNFRQAFSYHQQFTELKDSILNEEISKQILELKTKYEHAEQERKIAQLTNERKIREIEAEKEAFWNKALQIGLLLVCAIAVLTFYIFRTRLKNQQTLAAKNEEIRESNFRHKLSELELKALRAQMNPHFIFNCLNSINMVVLNGETNIASKYLTKFAKLIRMVLENSEHNTVPLADELSVLEIYIQLETLRFKQKVKYQLEVDPALDMGDTYIPSMVLQPLVENAIWHGLMHKNKGGTILISIKKDSKLLKCSIEDDGIGREKAFMLSKKNEMKGKSFGLQIVQERLKLMGKQELQKLINIEDLKDINNHNIGTRVNISVPIS